MKNSLRIIMITIFSLIQASIFLPNALPAKAERGDDPGITISSPDTLRSRQQIELKVTLSASAGKLNQDGGISITIPKSTVANKSDLTKQIVLGPPFFLSDKSITTDTQGNYVLHVYYDHTKIDQRNAIGYTFILKYGAPLFLTENTEIPDIAYFKAKLYQTDTLVSKASASSAIEKEAPGKPLLYKGSTRPHKEVQGVNAAIMSLSDPAANIFFIPINYNQQTLKQVVLEDTTPPETTMTDPARYIPATGDATPVKHIRIAKVTNRNANGTPVEWQYVTKHFADKITISPTGFAIDFGDLAKQDAYVVMYAEKVDEGITAKEFGVRTNQAFLKANGKIIKSAQAFLALDDSKYQSISLLKSVNQPTIATNHGELIYSLELKAHHGIIYAGTKVIDPLPTYTSFVRTQEADPSYFSKSSYDKKTNTVSYTLLQDISEGTSKRIDFRIDYQNPTATENDEIINKAFLNYSGTDIYSNDITVTLSNSAYLRKLDTITDRPLKGAVFKIIDKDAKKIADNLISDQNGIVSSGLLPPGHYQFIETTAPEGYLLDAMPIPFEVVSGQVIPIELRKTNTPVTTVSGKKNWQDDNDRAGKRPPNITIDLYRNGIAVDSKQVTKHTDWTYSFNQLPKYDEEGIHYAYQVKERPVKGYKTLQHGNDFTNIYRAKDSGTPPPKIKSPKPKGKPSEPIKKETQKPKNEQKNIESSLTHFPNTGDRVELYLLIIGILVLSTGFYMYRKK